MRALETNAIARWLSPAGWVALVVAAGCQTPTIPNLNDPEDVEHAPPAVLKQDLDGAYAIFAQRVRQGEITEAQARQMLTDKANAMIARIDIPKIPVSEAWRYGDIFRTAERWDLAKEAYSAGAKHAKSEDRRVNDTLRLAESMAHLGDIKGAIRIARTVLNASPRESAPILPSILLELTPAAEGKGHDIELAKLLEDAVRKHDATVVDPETEAGNAFLMAKLHHISNAWEKIGDLYRSAGRDDLALAALNRGNEMMKNMKR